MTEKELRSLSKLELLEMLRQQELEIEHLTVEKEETAKKLDDRRVSFEQAGSLADASVVLSGVMKAAQDAADVYLENIRTLEAEKKALAEKLERETVDKIASIYSEAEKRRADAENETVQILVNMQKFLDWHSSQLTATRAGFVDAVEKMGMTAAVYHDQMNAAHTRAEIAGGEAPKAYAAADTRVQGIYSSGTAPSAVTAAGTAPQTEYSAVPAAQARVTDSVAAQTMIANVTMDHARAVTADMPASQYDGQQ